MSESLHSLLIPAPGAPATGIYSVCSAHPWVLRAAALQARHDGTLLLIESTSNQVNQLGGYTGMRPADFQAFALNETVRASLPASRLVLGGDHLGPNPWRSLPASEAMDHGSTLVAEYARAGFQKLHLDASMSCAGDPAVLSNETVAERAAQLCAAAEAARDPAMPAPVYVIGTEVPVPGGATHSLDDGLPVTTPEGAAETLAVHKRVFKAAGLDAVWPRVLALVVQPGVEFGHDSVIDYHPGRAAALVRWLRKCGEAIVFEAHSTDYQNPARYRELVQDRFAILKVGPALTFAMREALDALEEIEAELVPDRERSGLRAVMEAAMLSRPELWQPYYPGNQQEQRLLRHYSYSDRIRYYWQEPEAVAAVGRLIENLSRVAIPETMLSRTLPTQYRRLRQGLLKPGDPESLIVDRIQDVLRDYAAACSAPKA